MGSNEFEQWNMSDFSKLSDSFSQMRDAVKPIVEATQRFQELLRPVVEIVNQYKSQIAETVKVIAEALRPVAAVEKLGNAQYVCWERMDDSFIDDVLSSQNVNAVLRERLNKSKYKSVSSTIEQIESHSLMKKHLRLFSQSIEAYTKGSCDLALTGLTSVFDGLLTSISRSSTHKLKPRIDVIKSKLERDEILDSNEYAMLSLAITIEKTLDSFSAFAPFDKPEPKTLNRNWIAHGRSNKKRTRLDCVKLINMIYGLLLISDIEQKEVKCNEQQ